MSQENRISVQNMALAVWEKKGRRGTLAAATGVGKTKPAVDTMMSLYNESMERGYKPSILMVVPTEELRDVTWPAEVAKWHGEAGERMWKHCVTPICYISMHKYRHGHYDLVVMDEAHHISALNSTFFENNIVIDVLGLTATAPNVDRDLFKATLLQTYAPVVFVFPLDQAVDEGLVAPYHVTVIMSPLDNHSKVIPAGTKDKPFKTTEAAQYAYLTSTLQKMYMKENQIRNSTTLIGTAKQKALAANAGGITAMTLKRMHFLYSLPSKERLLKKVIEKEVESQEVRTLVFCATIKQADQFFGKDVYHSKSKGDALARFQSGEIRTLGCVKALNEGVNIPDMDQAIIAQIDSNQRNLIQRIGRIVRYRPEHQAEIFVLCTEGTQDEQWLKKSLEELDPTRIDYTSSKNYLS